MVPQAVTMRIIWGKRFDSVSNTSCTGVVVTQGEARSRKRSPTN